MMQLPEVPAVGHQESEDGHNRGVEHLGDGAGELAILDSAGHLRAVRVVPATAEEAAEIMALCAREMAVEKADHGAKVELKAMNNDQKWILDRRSLKRTPNIFGPQ